MAWEWNNERCDCQLQHHTIFCLDYLGNQKPNIFYINCSKLSIIWVSRKSGTEDDIYLKPTLSAPSVAPASGGRGEDTSSTTDTEVAAEHRRTVGLLLYGHFIEATESERWNIKQLLLVEERWETGVSWRVAAGNERRAAAILYLRSLFVPVECAQNG